MICVDKNTFQSRRADDVFARMANLIYRMPLNATNYIDSIVVNSQGLVINRYDLFASPGTGDFG